MRTWGGAGGGEADSRQPNSGLSPNTMPCVRASKSSGRLWRTSEASGGPRTAAGGPWRAEGQRRTAEGFSGLRRAME
eukprot:3989138-Alexandrium_andersonii.AAC.1